MISTALSLSKIKEITSPSDKIPRAYKQSKMLTIFCNQTIFLAEFIYFFNEINERTKAEKRAVSQIKQAVFRLNFSISLKYNTDFRNNSVTPAQLRLFFTIIYIVLLIMFQCIRITLLNQLTNLKQKPRRNSMLVPGFYKMQKLWLMNILISNCKKTTF